MNFSLVVVHPPVWVRGVAVLPHLLLFHFLVFFASDSSESNVDFLSSYFLTKIESSSHTFFTLSLLSFRFGLSYGPRLGFSGYSVGALSFYIEGTVGVSFVLFFLCFLWWYYGLFLLTLMFRSTLLLLSEDHGLVVSFGSLEV